MVTFGQVRQWDADTLDAVVQSLTSARTVLLGEMDDIDRSARRLVWIGFARDRAVARTGQLTIALAGHGVRARDVANQLHVAGMGVSAVRRQAEALASYATSQELDIRPDGDVVDLRPEPDDPSLVDRAAGFLRSRARDTVAAGVAVVVAEARAVDHLLTQALVRSHVALDALDAAAAGDAGAVAAVANQVAQDAGPTTGGYRIGSPTRPTFTWDEDFVYGSKQAGARDWVARAKWMAMLNGGRLKPDLDDATAAYAHYWDNTGAPLEIDYEEAVAEDPAVRRNVDDEIARAALGAEELIARGSTRFSMTGDGQATQHYPQTENWQKAIGAYQQWSSADVWVEGDTVHMRVTIYAEDHYNFNRGQADIASGASDDENGRFTEIGWAKPFDSHGSVTREVTWPLGSPPPASAVDAPAGDDQWNPGREDRADSRPGSRDGDRNNRDTGGARVP